MKKPSVFIRIPLGTVVHDADGHPWVYYGYSLSTAGSQRHCFRITCPTPKGHRLPYEYTAVKRDTLIKKFPDLGEHWPVD